MPYRRAAAVVPAVVLATLLLASCAPSSDELDTEACAARDAFAAAVDDARTTVESDDPTVGELRDARDAVRTAFADLDEALDDVADNRLEDVERAWMDFDAAVEEIDEDATVPEAIDSLRDDVAAIDTARSNVDTEITCES